ncbi:hypothetical protein, partial [Mesobacillus selenatarsenatis]|uniref:hypothetical protein n=1 Tax=Mesobacillus selenatarsenatis TaxID=388741 RepID=UPI0005AADFFB
LALALDFSEVGNGSDIITSCGAGCPKVNEVQRCKKVEKGTKDLLKGFSQLRYFYIGQNH